MELEQVLTILKESLYVILVLTAFVTLAIFKGRQTLTNVILGLYLGLLLSLQFPYYDDLFAGVEGVRDQAIFSLLIFIVFSILATWLFTRILPREYDEKAFEGFGKKLALAVGGTILIMTYSYHAIPVTDLISPGGPMNFLFGSAEYSFWWLLTPIIILFVF